MQRELPGLRRGIRRSVVFLTRFQMVLLTVAILCLAWALPLIVPSMRESPTLVLYTALGCTIASGLGVYLLRNVSNYPGVEESFYIVPAFCAAYMGLILVLVLARIPYSRLLLTSAFAVTTIVSLALYTFFRRHIRLKIGVVAAGDYARAVQIPGIEWQLLHQPDDPVGDLDAISVDLLCDLPDEWERALATFALHGIPVYHSKHLRESLTGRVEIERLSENNFGTLSPLYAYMAFKAAVDWVAALVAVVLLLPAFAVTAVLIKLDTPGPAIFRQTRVGYRGKPFRVLKFRTMTVERPGDGSLRDAAMTKTDDARVTRVGRFLRRTRLDELPQLFNVLAGQMSWIGPRPEAAVLSRWYETEIPFYRYRHIVRPGITGWAQVHQGHVADVDQVREKLNYDFYYIKNFSLWIDVIVVARTIRTMATGFGSR